ncbi:MAG: glycosyltransferase [Turicibacter sp.]|nr:glycosyltransferase [Turicibacter sp.]
MLLTIGMIVKNEEEYLRNCLNGLKPILEQVDSELIICDTGSTDATVEIAREFTDKIIEVEWRNDFAWARQKTLDRARGKWYMYLDADEIFQDVNDLIEFFNSGEQKEYGCATFALNNVTHTNQLMASFNPLRLYRLKKGMQWHGKIHEHIKPVYLPMKTLKSLALHYGYDYRNEAERLEKQDRNLKPMLEIYENDPKDTRNIFQILLQYGSSENVEDFDKLANEALEIYKTEPKDSFYHAIIQNVVGFHAKRLRHKELVELTKDFFENTEPQANAYFIKFNEALALQTLKRYEEAADSAVAAYEFLKKKERNEINNQVLSIVGMPHLEASTIVITIVANYITSGNFDQAASWLDSLDESDKRKNTDLYSVFVNHVLKEKIDNISKLYDYVTGKFGIDSPQYSNMLNAIESNIKDKNQKNRVSAEIIKGHEDLGDGYIRLHRLRHLDAAISQTAETQQELDYFMREPGPFSQYFADVLLIAMKYKHDISALADKMRVTNTRSFVYNAVRTNHNISDILINYIDELDFAETCTSIRALRLVSGMLAAVTDREAIMDYLKDDKDKKQLQLFEMFTRVRYKYLCATYSPDIYCDESVLDLPEEDAFVYYIGRAYECKDTNDTAGYAQNLRLSLNVSPDKNSLVAQIAAKLKEETSGPTIKEQLAEQTSRLKSIIYTMINTGNFSEAQKILETYETINPSDPEIPKIRSLMQD